MIGRRGGGGSGSGPMRATIHLLFNVPSVTNYFFSRFLLVFPIILFYVFGTSKHFSLRTPQLSS